MNALEDLLEAVDDMILVEAVARDWKEAVTIAGKLLVENGRAKEMYIDAMIRTVEELGPYSVIAPGVAIPHARPEDGAVKPGFSIVVLKEPVYFGSPNDPVHVVIGFTAVDKTSHIGALQTLAVLLSSEEFIESIKRVRSKDDVKRVIKEYSEKLLKQRNM